MTKIPPKDHTAVKLELIQAVMAGRVTGYCFDETKIGQLQRLTLQLDFDPSLMTRLAEIDLNRANTAATPV